MRFWKVLPYVFAITCAAAYADPPASGPLGGTGDIGSGGLTISTAGLNPEPVADMSSNSIEAVLHQPDAANMAEKIRGLTSQELSVVFAKTGANGDAWGSIPKEYWTGETIVRGVPLPTGIKVNGVVFSGTAAEQGLITAVLAERTDVKSLQMLTNQAQEGKFYWYRQITLADALASRYQKSQDPKILTALENLAFGDRVDLHARPAVKMTIVKRLAGNPSQEAFTLLLKLAMRENPSSVGYDAGRTSISIDHDVDARTYASRAVEQHPLYKKLIGKVAKTGGAAKMSAKGTLSAIAALLALESVRNSGAPAEKLELSKQADGREKLGLPSVDSPDPQSSNAGKGSTAGQAQ